jgi:hypothetical protein
MYDNFGQWVPDNSGIDTSPDDLSDFEADGGDSVGSASGPLTHNSPPTNGMDPSDMDTSTMMPGRMGPLSKNG